MKMYWRKHSINAEARANTEVRAERRRNQALAREKKNADAHAEGVRRIMENTKKR